MKSIVKTIGIGVLCAGLVLGMAGCAAEAEKNTITAVGAGSVKVTPDMAKIYLGVNTVDETAEAAQEQNAETMAAVMEKLKSLGITEENMKTGSYSVYPNYYYDYQTGAQSITGYTVTNMVTVTTEKVDGVAEIIDSAAEAGSNINNGIDFTLKDKEEHYNTALKLAMENAAKKAGVMAESMGKTLGQTVDVKEYQSYDAYTSYAYYESAKGMGAARSDVSTPISYDDIEVTANVEVTYQY